MKNFLILLPVAFILALFQATFLSLNLLLLLVLLASVIKPGRQNAFLAFGSGFLLDLVSGLPLGLSSFLFLVFSFVLFLYRRRFDLAQPFLLFLLVFFFATLFSWFVYHDWQWRQGLVLVILVYVVRLLMKYFGHIQGGARLKL